MAPRGRALARFIFVIRSIFAQLFVTRYTSYTPGTARTDLRTASRWLASAISKVNLENAVLSLAVVTEACKIFTALSDKAFVTSESSRARSSASTWILTRNTELTPGLQRTSINLSPWFNRRSDTLMQSSRCTETPLPLVIKPVIWSPGTGVQHRANFTKRSSAPTTSTPLSLFLAR